MVQLAGEDILASDIKVPKYIQKVANEIVNNSAVLQNDNDFALLLPIGTYRVETFLHVSCANNAADIRTAWAFSGTVTSTGRSIMGAAVASTDGADTNMRWSGHGFATSVISGVSSTVASLIHEDLLFTVTVAGTLNYQWAQGTATVADTTASNASRLYITEVEAL
jgi:hypothetical protein